MPPVATRFPKGRSGNPGGRPKSLTAFRARCRRLSRELLDVIKARMTEPGVRLDHLVMAFAAIADRGGYLPADRQHEIDLGSTRLLLLAMALRGLNDKQRGDILAMFSERKAELPAS